MSQLTIRRLLNVGDWVRLHYYFNSNPYGCIEKIDFTVPFPICVRTTSGMLIPVAEREISLATDAEVLAARLKGKHV